MAQTVKNLPAMQETQVWSLAWEDNPGEWNGNPLQYSCMENPMDRGAWWATVHGIAKGQTRLNDQHFTFIWNRLAYSYKILYNNTWEAIKGHHSSVEISSQLHCCFLCEATPDFHRQLFYPVSSYRAPLYRHLSLHPLSLSLVPQ